MRLLLFGLLVLILAGCSAPIAKPDPNPTLVVATDYIAPGDTALFKSFEKKYKVKIQLKQISADSLIELYQKDRYNTGIDVVLMHQLFDMRKLSVIGMLEPIHDKLPENAVHNNKNTYVACGFDPFVCISKSGKNVHVNIYDDLSGIPYINMLSTKSEAHFFAGFEFKLNRVRTYKRIEKIKKTGMKFSPQAGDSAVAIFTTLSQYQMHRKDSILKKFTQISYPNRSTSGVFHDLLTFGIVEQTSNYQLSIQLLEWLSVPSVNRKFNKSREYQSLSSSREYSIYGVRPDKLTQYHLMILRMIAEFKESDNMSEIDVRHGT